MPCGAATRNRCAADAHGARGEVLQNGADAAHGVSRGGGEGAVDRAAKGVGVGAGHPRPKLHAPRGGGGRAVRPENPEQVIGDLHGMHELARNGQGRFGEVRHTKGRWPDELVSLTASQVVLATVLASVDLGCIIGSTYCNLS